MNIKELKQEINTLVSNITKISLTPEDYTDLLQYFQSEFIPNTLNALGSKVMITAEYKAIRVNSEGETLVKIDKDTKLYPYLGISPTGFYVGEGLPYLIIGEEGLIEKDSIFIAKRGDETKRVLPIAKEAYQAHMNLLDNLKTEQQSLWKTYATK